jgi:hypothetical protein
VWFLAIVITVLVHSPHGQKPTTQHQTVSLAFPTQYTCQEAQEDGVDTNYILTRANDQFKTTKARKWALKVTTECKPETTGVPSSDGWKHDNRIYRS